jgi:hypothetical protein
MGMRMGMKIGIRTRIIMGIRMKKNGDKNEKEWGYNWE